MPWTDSKISDISNYRFSAKDKLFFDANIWLYLFGPPLPKRQRQIDAYSTAFRRITASGALICTSELIISEFINVYFKSSYDIYASRHKTKKRFRASRDFEPAGKIITKETRKILSYCQFVNSGVQNMDSLDELAVEYATGSRDFNDQSIVKTCKANGFTLVTDDGDFANAGLSILTANENMLRRR